MGLIEPVQWFLNYFAKAREKPHQLYAFGIRR